MSSCARHDLLQKARDEWGFIGHPDDIFKAVKMILTILTQLEMGDVQYLHLLPQLNVTCTVYFHKTAPVLLADKDILVATIFKKSETKHGHHVFDIPTIANNVGITSIDLLKWLQKLKVTEALAQAGLESSNLIVGIDFTKSNEWTGKHSFNRRSLHHISDVQNPYEQAISIIGRTLSAFDEDNLIPCFGFGDASTHDQDVFSFYPDERPCNGFSEALSRYREIVPDLRLSGPTSFAPIIEMAMTIVAQSGGQYHVLVIIADGQVTRSVDLEFGQLSSQEQKTVDAIVRASEFPLSIILVGVGDGPWDTMKEFDDNIPARAFDNFQFVNFTEIMSKNIPQSKKETEFALGALMEIPPQYKATIELGILGSQHVGKSPERVPLPTPVGSYGAPSMSSKQLRSSTSYQEKKPYYPAYEPPVTMAPPSSSSNDQQVCPICLTNPKNMAFGCGHQTCTDCGPSLHSCPICRTEIVTRIRLY